MAPSPGTDPSYRSGSPWGGVAVSSRPPAHRHRPATRGLLVRLAQRVAVRRGRAVRLLVGGCGSRGSSCEVMRASFPVPRRGGRYRRGVSADGDHPAGGVAAAGHGRQRLTVEVAAVRWRADGEDFAVLAGVTDEGEEVTVTGPLAHVHAGETVLVEGAWREHPRHGRQFAAERVRLQERDERRGARRTWPASSTSARAARRGSRAPRPRAVLAELDRDPGGRLREVPGIGPTRLGAAVALVGGAGRRSGRCGCSSTSTACRPRPPARIARALGPGAIERLRTDPYAVAEVDGVGFATADALARGAGHAARRPRAARRRAAPRARRRPRPTGTASSPAPSSPRARGGCSAPTPTGAIDELAASGRLVVDPTADAVADPVLDRVEARLARRARELCDAPPQLRLRAAKRPTAGFVPTDGQWAVVDAVLGHRLVDPHGRPGHRQDERRCGRSSTSCAARAAASGCARRRARPRGAWPRRPARRRRRSTACSSGSPTRASRAGPTTRSPGRTCSSSTRRRCSPSALADALLGAVGPRTHVLLVGDVDQLAPVGAGPRARGPDRLRRGARRCG